jgi:hypothetical protein
MKKKILILAGILVIIFSGLVAYAFMSTWGKTDLDIKIHINKKLVQESGFGESPTFAIWLESAETHEIRAVYITRRAAEGDWEGKKEVPAALPRWFEIVKMQKESSAGSIAVDGYSGATPKPGYFTAKANLKPGSNWICWIEVNLAGDFNEFYIGKNNEDSETDKFLSGQPAILYRVEVTATEGAVFEPVLVAMTVLGAQDGKIIQPLKGITTAAEIFDEINIKVVKPKPRILKLSQKPDNV